MRKCYNVVKGGDNMYREYEDPFGLEAMLKEAERRLDETFDESERMEISEDINDLKDRINYAWQDADE